MKNKVKKVIFEFDNGGVMEEELIWMNKLLKKAKTLYKNNVMKKKDCLKMLVKLIKPT
jgi:hypothetical protein